MARRRMINVEEVEGPVGDFTNSLFDIFEGYEISKQVARDVKEYQLTREEALELMDAYYEEDTFEGGVHLYRELTNKGLENLNQSPQNSSQEILDKAKARLDAKKIQEAQKTISHGAEGEPPRSKPVIGLPPIPPTGPAQDTNPTAPLPKNAEDFWQKRAPERTKASLKNVNGQVFVHAYDRHNGDVRSHTRSRPQ